MSSPTSSRKGAIQGQKKRPAAQARMARLREMNTDASSAFYQERRREIIDAAAQVFRERGFAASHFGMIAEKLGTDRATIYYYFASKQALFREVVREVAQQAVQTAESIAAGPGGAPQKLNNAFRVVLETYSSSYPYMHVFLQENVAVDTGEQDEWQAEGRQWYERYYQAIRSIIQQGVDEGSMQPVLPVGLTTMGVLGTVNWAYRWYRPGGSLSPAEIGEGFAQMVLNGMATKPRRAVKTALPSAQSSNAGLKAPSAEKPVAAKKGRTPKKA